MRHFYRDSKNARNCDNLFRMNSLEQNILAAFDRRGKRTLSLADLGDADTSSGTVARLVERGWLRATGEPGMYARTENGRLQLAGPRDVTIYSRPGCHLCEEAKGQIAPLLAEFGARLTEINIDEDADLRAQVRLRRAGNFSGSAKGRQAPRRSETIPAAVTR